MSGTSQSITAFWLGYTPSGGADEGPLLDDTPDYVDRVVLAFSNLYPGNVTCNGFLQKANSADKIKAGLAAIKANSPDTKLMLSIIGTPSPPVGWNTGITDPDEFGKWLNYVCADWGFDGIDIDNEDLDSNPGQQFIDTVKGMRKAMPDKIITLDTYIFGRDKDVIKELADDLSGINTMAYFLEFDSMTALVEQYATIIDPSKISIGVKADLVSNQGTSLEDTIKLSKWNPSGGAKAGMMLWNLSSDIEAVTGKPDGSWSKAIHENLG
uniref:glycosyl hydrolase family 18 protein n=1 Tax=uncultured Erythrobacter sp. TaxID=263913 RepID=UPI002612165C|nr:glycosyl hydrolase family 18 protein [uncultured Erythrobacter sp.]